MPEKRKFAQFVLSTASSRAVEKNNPVRADVSPPRFGWNSSIVEPVDYENYLLKHKVAFAGDPSRELVLFPTEDIKLIRLVNVNRYLSSNNPLEALNSDSFANNALGRHSVRFFTNPKLVYVHQNSALYRGSFCQLPRGNAVDAHLGPLIPDRFAMDLRDTFDQTARCGTSHGPSSSLPGLRSWAVAMNATRFRLSANEPDNATDFHAVNGNVQEPFSDSDSYSAPVPIQKQPRCRSGIYIECKLLVGDRKLYTAQLRKHQLCSSGSQNSTRDSSDASSVTLKSYCLRRLSLPKSVDRAKAPTDHFIIAPVGWKPIGRSDADTSCTVVHLDDVNTIHCIGDNWLKLDCRGQPPNEVFIYFDPCVGGSKKRMIWLRQIECVLNAQRMHRRSFQGTPPPTPPNAAIATDATFLNNLLQQETAFLVTHRRQKDRLTLIAICPEVRLAYDDSATAAFERAQAKSLPNADRPSSLDNGMSDQTLYPPPFPDRTEQLCYRRILVTFLRLRSRVLASIEQNEMASGVAKVDNPEPYFVSAFLVNSLDGRRVSEDFYWNPNSPFVESMIPSDVFRKPPWTCLNNATDCSKLHSASPSVASINSPTESPASLLLDSKITLRLKSLNECRSALFSVPETVSSISYLYLVVKVDKILNGSISSAVEKYVKAAAGGSIAASDDLLESGEHPSTGNKLISSYHCSMRTYCQHLGRYRMPFAWGAKSLASVTPNFPLFKVDQSKSSEFSLIQLVQTLARLCDSNQSGGFQSPGGCSVSLTEKRNTLNIANARDEVTPDIMERVLKTSVVPLVLEVAVSELLDPDPDAKLPLLNELELFTPDLSPLNITNNPGALNYAIPSGHPRLQPRELIREVEHLWDMPLPSASVISGDAYQGNADDSGLYAHFGHYPVNSPSVSQSGTTLGTASVFSGSNRDSIISSSSVHSFDLQPPSNSLSRVGSLERSQTKSLNDSTNRLSSMSSILEPVPFTSFLNTLYVSPRSLNLSVKHHFSRARNLSCFMELRVSDDLLASSALNVFHTRPSSRQPTFDAWSNTAVTYHEASPQFNDTFKLCMPLHLTEQCHLLFRFFHVSVDAAASCGPRDRSASKKSLESSTGYAWLPILGPDGNVNTGIFHLPVASNLPRGYLGLSSSSRGPAGSSESEVSWLEGGKPLFIVQLDCLSSIYTFDSILSKFFVACNTLLGRVLTLPCPGTSSNIKSKSHRVTFSEEPIGNINPAMANKNFAESLPSPYVAGLHLCNAIKSLLLVNHSELIHFLPSVINQFMEILLIGAALGHRWTIALPVSEKNSLMWMYSFKPQCCNTSIELLKTAIGTMTMLISRLCNSDSLRPIRQSNRTLHFRQTSFDAFRHRSNRHYLLRAYVKYSFDPYSLQSACEHAYLSKSSSDQSWANTDNLLSVPLHHAVVRGLVLLLIDSNCTDLILVHLLSNIWFPFALVIKSMSQFLCMTHKIKGDRSGQSRFPSSFSEDLALLIKLIGARLSASGPTSNVLFLSKSSSYASSLDRLAGSSSTGTGSLYSNPERSYSTSQRPPKVNVSSSPTPADAPEIISSDGLESSTTAERLVAQIGRNNSLSGQVNGTDIMAETAKFIGHLFNLMDRSYVLKRVRDLLIFLEIGPRMSVHEIDWLNELRFQLLETLSQYEFFIQLNLPSLPPRQTINTPMFDLRLTEQFQQEHFLVGLLLSSISCLLAGCVNTGSWAAGHTPSHSHRRPLVLLRNLLAKHALDPRFAGSKTCQARIAALYLPLICIVLANPAVYGSPGGALKSTILAAATCGDSTAGTSHVNFRRKPKGSPSKFYGSMVRTSRTFETSSTGSNSSSASSLSTENGGSIISYGTDNLTPSRCSTYFTKDGKVAPHILNQISGGSLGLGPLRVRRGEAVQVAIDLPHGTMSPARTGSTLTLTEADGINGNDVDESVNGHPPVTSESNSVDVFFDDDIIPNIEPHWGEQLLALVGNLDGAPQNRPSTAPVSNSSKSANIDLLHAQADLPPSKTESPQLHQHRLPVDCPNVGPRRLTDKCQRDLFVCVLHILSSVTEEHLVALFRGFSILERVQFLSVLNFAIQHLRYRGRKCIEHYEHISRSAVGRPVGDDPSIPPVRRHRKNDDSPCAFRDNLRKLGYNNRTDYLVALEGNMATEAGLIVLDLLHTFADVFKSEFDCCQPNSPLFRGILETYVTLLSNNPSDRLVEHTFAALRVFVRRNAKILFSESTDILNVLCVAALRCADECFQHPQLNTIDAESSAVPSGWRSQNQLKACAFLYRLWKFSYEAYGLSGFHRVHLQTIIASSKLVSEISPGFDAILSLLHQLVEWDMRVPSGGRVWNSDSTQQAFSDACFDLIDRIRTVVTSTVEMRQHSDDPERLIDLHYRLAKSYSSNPALRRTWLEELAKLHMSTQSLAELAMTKLHIAALMAEYLKERGCLDREFPQGLVAFGVITSNICHEETPLRGESAAMELPYTQNDLLVDINEAAATMEAAGYFEAVLPMYSLIIPVYHSRRDYESLSQIYHHIGRAYENIINAELKTSYRLFATYFRVTFYGSLFETLSGKSFVYRADACRKLNAMCSELLDLYGSKYGTNSIKLLTDVSRQVDSLDPNASYIQVLHVEPYKVAPASGKPLTTYEKHFDVRQFIFDTPFVVPPDTPIGANPLVSVSKRTSDLASQWIRRTVLTTEGAFPHLRRRLEIINSTVTDLTPIDVAIDAITTKISELRGHVSHASALSTSTLQSHSDSGFKPVTVASIGIHCPIYANTTGAKADRTIPLLMDMQLQGALLTTVNAGPMAYAETFLKSENQWKYAKEKVARLKDLFFEFLSVCLVLLTHYHRLMTPVHVAKYQAMRESLDQYRVDLSNLLKEEIIVDEKLSYIGPKSSAAVRRPSIPNP